jgi:ribosomal protein S18 acetylase RimI-like enzyme
VDIVYRDDGRPTVEQVVALYKTMAWSSADKPRSLHAGLLASHALVTAWDGPALVGLGNAISDGHLVVYFPHLIVHPDYQRHGIGSRLVRMLMGKYAGFHQQVLIADGRAIDFYKKLGFARAGATEPLWIFDGHEHD